MFHIAIEIFIGNVCNMHNARVGAWHIGVLPVTSMATKPRFQGKGITGVNFNFSFGLRCQTKGDTIRIACLTLAFSGAKKRAEMLPHPCILENPQTKGNKIRKGYLTPAFSRIPEIRGTKTEVAASPLSYWGPKRVRKCYVTPAFLGIH